MNRLEELLALCSFSQLQAVPFPAAGFVIILDFTFQPDPLCPQAQKGEWRFFASFLATTRI